MVNVKKQLISSNSRTYGRNNKKQFVTVHQTGNTSKGANAQMHADYQANGAGGRSASWHYQVDDKEAIQSFSHDAQCWHATDGRGPGNLNSIAVEICINSDGDYKKAVQNGAELVRQILDQEGLSIDKVKQHADWSNKNCPAQIRAGKDGIGWNDFIKLVEGKTNSSNSNPKQSTYDGNSIVDYLISIKEDHSFANRKRLAEQYGIKNYTGTASQNTKLLKKLRSGSKPKKSAPKGDQKTNSVVDYLKSVKVDSSYNNRKKLAENYGIKNYKGTASQNTQLLKKLRG